MKTRRKLLPQKPAFRFIISNGLASVQRLVRGQYSHIYATGPEQAERDVHELITNPDSPLHDLYLTIDV